MAEVEIEASSLNQDEYKEEDSIYSDPNVAVIVSFIKQFGSLIFDKPPLMSDLMGWINSTDEVSNQLQEVHVKLLRKLKRSVVADKWEKAVIKFCYSYGGSDDAFEIERYGYLHSSIGVKLRVLKNLLESQFDTNSKFKNLINAKQSHDLRLEPYGKDKDGNVYYCQFDERASIKIYQENLDEESWTVVASNRDELFKLIEELKGHKPIRPLLKDLIDEDSSSNSRPSEKEEKIIDQEYSIDNASNEFPLKQTIRLIKKSENMPMELNEKEFENAEKKNETPDRDLQKKRKRK